jgi:glyoxalase family protein
VTSFSVPEQSLSSWEERLRAAGIPVEGSGKRFDEEVLTFADPDGLRLEMVGHAGSKKPQAHRGTLIPEVHTIRRFYSVKANPLGEVTGQCECDGVCFARSNL